MERKSGNSNYKNQAEYKAIRDWREDERPRERLKAHGAGVLSDSELLAILIGSGAKGFSALDAARELINKAGSLTKLASQDISEMKKTKGMGDARSISLAAAFELANRIQAEPFESKKTFKTPEDVANIYRPKMRGAKKEQFRCLLLNSSNQIIKDTVVSEGSLNASIVHPREVFRPAIIESAASVILLHNHPSGNPRPSREDIAITNQLIEAGKLLDIKVLDHLIIAGEEFSSFVKLGLM